MLVATLFAALLWLGATVWRILRLQRLAAHARRRAERAWAAQRLLGADLLALLARMPGHLPSRSRLALAHERLQKGDPAPWMAALDGLVAADAALPPAAGALVARLLPGLEEARTARRNATALEGLLAATSRSPVLDPLGLVA
ncbi:hypothetical protein IIA16_06605 [bacterium]|nr:hypothetical protein [bacterium]